MFLQKLPAKVIGENYRADVAAVHHQSFLLTHRLLERHHSLADKADGADLGGGIAYFERADAALHVLAVEDSVLRTVGLDGKGYLQFADMFAQPGLQLLGGGILVGVGAIVAGVERYAAVHGTCVHILVSCGFGYRLGDSGFPA